MAGLEIKDGMGSEPGGLGDGSPGGETPWGSWGKAPRS